MGRRASLVLLALTVAACVPSPERPAPPPPVAPGAHGPFAVDELRGYRFLEGAYPDRERLPDEAPRFVTRAWPATAFSDAVWTSPHKQRMVELMMEDLARGIPLEASPRPGEARAPGGAGAPTSADASAATPGAGDATSSPGSPTPPADDAPAPRPTSPR